MSLACQVQRPCPWRPCGCPTVATWFWGGGPSLAMCSGHDEEMKRHAKGCKACRERLERREEPRQ